MISLRYKLIAQPWLLISLFITAHSHAQQPTAYYVSLNGNDANEGTLNKPFATLQKARLAVRFERLRRPDQTFVIYLRKGAYYLTKSFLLDSSDAGTKNSPVIYSAYSNEIVSITGGINIPLSKVVAVTDKNVLRRLPETSRQKVRQVNLKALGITDYGSIKPKGFGRPYTPASMELFCNKEAMRPARWPNDSMVPIGKVLDPGSIPRNGDYSGRGGKFSYETKRPNRWTHASDVWISGFFKYGYADDAVNLSNIDTVNQTFTTGQETRYGFEGGKIFQRWFAFNLLEEIDEPGEYYVDRQGGILYFIPPVSPLKTLEVSVTQEPLVSMENASYVHWKNIVFECGRGIGMYIEGGTEDRIDQCTFRNLGLVAISLGKGIAPSGQSEWSEGWEPASRIVGTLYNYMYDHTTFDRTAGHGHVIRDCSIYNTGSGGIILGGGNRNTLDKGNNQVLNCRIYNFNRIERSYKAGINVDGVGNIIRNCEIYECPGSALLLHGNDHLIEYNNIHDAVMEGDDMGAIYYGRDPSELGNKIRYNFFHHIGNGYGTLVAIYHDDGACGAEVTGNVFYTGGSPTILIGGGSDNVYRNNIFIDCSLAFHLDDRLSGWAKGFIEKNGLFEKRLQAVNYQNNPFASTYPSVVNYFTDSPGKPKRNFIEENVFIDVSVIHNGKPEWAYVGKNFSSSSDPGFYNFQKMNFKLKFSSIVFKSLPGFKDIPFEKIGIQRRN